MTDSANTNARIEVELRLEQVAKRRVKGGGRAVVEHGFDMEAKGFSVPEYILYDKISAKEKKTTTTTRKKSYRN